MSNIRVHQTFSQCRGLTAGTVTPYLEDAQDVRDFENRIAEQYGETADFVVRSGTVTWDTP